MTRRRLVLVAVVALVTLIAGAAFLLYGRSSADRKAPAMPASRSTTPAQASPASGSSASDGVAAAPDGVARCDPMEGPPPPLPQALAVPVVPSSFRGEWNETLEDCGTASEGRLVITADRIDFPASRGPITSVAPENASEIWILAELARDQGRCWEALYRYRLSPDGKALTDTGDEFGTTRYRCPAAGRQSPSN